MRMLSLALFATLALVIGAYDAAVTATTSQTIDATQAPRRARARRSPSIDPRLVFACGIVAIFGALVMAIVIPRPEQTELRMLAVIFGLGGASFTSGFAGLLEIETKWLKAGGPLAVFIFIVWIILGGQS